MTREEFVRRVMEIIESGKLEELDELYDEIVYREIHETESTTLSGRTVTIKWGTP